MKAFVSIALVGALIVVSGCRQEPAPKSDSSTKTGSHDHSHAADGHGHSHDHDHGPGPHGGTIADWGGGKFHVEFVVDHAKQEATIFILGEDEKSPVPIDASELDLKLTDPATELTLTAKPLESDPSGKSSRFVGNHKNLGIEREFAGTISGVVGGTPYFGDFKEEAHDHDHK